MGSGLHVSLREARAAPGRGALVGHCTAFEGVEVGGLADTPSPIEAQNASSGSTVHEQGLSMGADLATGSKSAEPCFYTCGACTRHAADAVCLLGNVWQRTRVLTSARMASGSQARSSKKKK